MAEYWHHTEVNGSPDGRPLLLFLHGAGESGDNGNRNPLQQVTLHGPCSGKFAGAPAMLQQLDPFVRVAPHLRIKGGSWATALVREVIDEVRHTRPDVDQANVIVIGLSRGGKGALELIAEYGKELGIRAAALFCPERMDRLAQAVATAIPIYVFHGTGDAIVSLSEDRRATYAAYQARPNFRWSEVPAQFLIGDNRHNCWTHVLEQPELYQWFTDVLANPALGQKKQNWPALP